MSGLMPVFAQVFNERGEGVIVRGGKAMYDNLIEKTPGARFCS